ncbi:MAG: hypothetical protein KF809_18455 [Chloroflexi bacterium]|nr:hypothetical protein [Chloroflexota bacterium]
MREMETRRPTDTASPVTPAVRLSASPRALTATAVTAVAVLVLLVPTRPVLGLLMMAAIVGGVAAASLRRSNPHPTGSTLTDLEAHGYRILRERVAPSLAGTISCLAIGPGGVFIIEVRDDPGRIRVRGDRLVIDGRSLALATRLKGQVEAVNRAIGTRIVGSSVPVTPVVCVRRAELPLLRRDIGGVAVLREAQVVAAILQAPRVVDVATAATLTDLADAVMPAAGRVAALRPSETAGYARSPGGMVAAPSPSVGRLAVDPTAEAALPA